LHAKKNGHNGLDITKKITEPLEKISTLCSALINTTTQEPIAKQYLEQIQEIIKNTTENIHNA